MREIMFDTFIAMVAFAGAYSLINRPADDKWYKRLFELWVFGFMVSLLIN